MLGQKKKKKKGGVRYQEVCLDSSLSKLDPPELCDRSLALLVEPALLPSTKGSSMSLPLPSERLSSLSLRGMSSSPLQGIERSFNKCTRETLGTF